VTDPARLQKGAEDARVLRGSSWSDYPWLCRAAYRQGRPPAAGKDSAGCRVVLRGD